MKPVDWKDLWAELEPLVHREADTESTLPSDD